MIPFTTAFDDNNPYFEWQTEMFPVDIWMPNSGYRSSTTTGYFGFSNLWSGECALAFLMPISYRRDTTFLAAFVCSDVGVIYFSTPLILPVGSPAEGFSGFYKLSCKYQFPTLIGEMNPVGYQSPPNNSAPSPLGFPTLWRDLLKHVSQGAIGGFFFSWNDEAWKEHWDPPQDKLGISHLSIACDATGCSNQANVWIADAITRKGWEYDAVCCGATSDGTPYNYGTDVFQLLGREPQTLETATNDCPAAFWNGQTYVARGGYVSQYYEYPPTLTSAPTTPPASTTPPTVTTEAPSTTLPPTEPVATTLPPVTPPLTTKAVPTAPPSSESPLPTEPSTGKIGLTSDSASLRAAMALVAVMLAALALLV